MKKSGNGRGSELIITFIILLLSIIYFHPVIDDYSFFDNALASGQFSNFAYFDFQFQGFICIREVYRLFYHIFPRFNWHYIFNTLYAFGGLYLVLRSLRVIILKNIRHSFFISAVQLLVALFFIENIVFVSQTRTSLIFCGIALFNLAFTKILNKKIVLLNAIVFILGMFLRPESAPGMILLVGVGFLIYNFNILMLFKRIWLPVLITSIFLAVFAIDLKFTDVYVRRVEPEIEYKMMAKRVVDISEMKTAEDSVKYEAALQGMWFDVNEMTPAFMRSMILPGVSTDFRHVKDVFLHLMGFYSFYPFIWCAVSVLFLAGLWILPDGLMRATKILLFQLCTFIIIYCLDYNGFLISYRHFINLQIISLLIIGFYFFDSPDFNVINLTNIFTLLTLLLLYCSVGAAIYNYKQENVRVYNKVEKMELTMKKFERTYKNRIVVSTIDGRFLFDQNFSIESKKYTANKYLMFDWFEFSLTPKYVDYLNSQCNCNVSNPVAFFRWLSTNNALYLSTPYRYNLTKRYMQIVYGCALNFNEPVRINSLLGIENSETDSCEVSSISVADD